MTKNSLRVSCKEHYPTDKKGYCTAKIEVNLLGSSDYVSRAVKGITKMVDFFKRQAKDG